MKMCRKVSKKIIIIVANFTSLRVLVNRIDWIVVICKTLNAQNPIELNSECIARQMIFTKPNIDNDNMTKILSLFHFVGAPFYETFKKQTFCLRLPFKTTTFQNDLQILQVYLVVRLDHLNYRRYSVFYGTLHTLS